MKNECEFAAIAADGAGRTMSHGLLTRLGEVGTVEYQPASDSYNLACRQANCKVQGTAILGERFGGVPTFQCCVRRQMTEAPEEHLVATRS